MTLEITPTASPSQGMVARSPSALASLDQQRAALMKAQMRTVAASYARYQETALQTSTAFESVQKNMQATIDDLVRANAELTQRAINAETHAKQLEAVHATKEGASAKLVQSLQQTNSALRAENLAQADKIRELNGALSTIRESCEKVPPYDESARGFVAMGMISKMFHPLLNLLQTCQGQAARVLHP